MEDNQRFKSLEKRITAKLKKLDVKQTPFERPALFNEQDSKLRRSDLFAVPEARPRSESLEKRITAKLKKLDVKQTPFERPALFNEQDSKLRRSDLFIEKKIEF